MSIPEKTETSTSPSTMTTSERWIQLQTNHQQSFHNHREGPSCTKCESVSRNLLCDCKHFADGLVCSSKKGREHNFEIHGNLVANLIGEYDLCSIMHYKLTDFRKDIDKKKLKKEKKHCFVWCDSKDCLKHNVEYYGSENCGTETILPIDKNKTCDKEIGNQQKLSDKDVKKINDYYACHVYGTGMLFCPFIQIRCCT